MISIGEKTERLVSVWISVNDEPDGFWGIAKENSLVNGGFSRFSARPFAKMLNLCPAAFMEFSFCETYEFWLGAISIQTDMEFGGLLWSCGGTYPSPESVTD